MHLFVCVYSCTKIGFSSLALWSFVFLSDDSCIWYADGAKACICKNDPYICSKLLSDHKLCEIVSDFDQVREAYILH